MHREMILKIFRKTKIHSSLKHVYYTGMTGKKFSNFCGPRKKVMLSQNFLFLLRPFHFYVFPLSSLCFPDLSHPTRALFTISIPRKSNYLLKGHKKNGKVLGELRLGYVRLKFDVLRLEVMLNLVRSIRLGSH